MPLQKALVDHEEDGEIIITDTWESESHPHDVLCEAVREKFSSDIPWLPNYRTIFYRTKVTLENSFPAFTSGAFWQYMGWYLCTSRNHSTYSDRYYFATGFGDMLGTFTGNLIQNLFVFCIFGEAGLHEGAFPVVMPIEKLQVALLQSAGAFFSGWLWQPAVGLTLNLDFSEQFFVVWMICAFGYWVGLFTFRVIFGLCCGWQSVEPKASPPTVQYDMTLAVSIGFGASCFTATDSSISGNFMAKWGFGIHNGDPVWLQVVKAGASVYFGFVASQLVQNLIVSPGQSWADVAGVDEDEPSLSPEGQEGQTRRNPRRQLRRIQSLEEPDENGIPGFSNNIGQSSLESRLLESPPAKEGNGANYGSGRTRRQY